MISPNTDGVMKFSWGKRCTHTQRLLIRNAPVPNLWDVDHMILPSILCAWPSWGRSERRPCERSAACQPPPATRAGQRGRGCEGRDAGTSPGISAGTRRTPPGGNDTEEWRKQSFYLFQLWYCDWMTTGNKPTGSHLTPELVVRQREQPLEVLDDKFGMF